MTLIPGAPAAAPVIPARPGLPPDLGHEAGGKLSERDQKLLSQVTLNPPSKEGCTAGQLAAVNGSTEPPGAR